MESKIDVIKIWPGGRQEQMKIKESDILPPLEAAKKSLHGFAVYVRIEDMEEFRQHYILLRTSLR